MIFRYGVFYFLMLESISSCVRYSVCRSVTCKVCYSYILYLCMLYLVMTLIYMKRSLKVCVIRCLFTSLILMWQNIGIAGKLTSSRTGPFERSKAASLSFTK